MTALSKFKLLLHSYTSSISYREIQRKDKKRPPDEMSCKVFACYKSYSPHYRPNFDRKLINFTSSSFHTPNLQIPHQTSLSIDHHYHYFIVLHNWVVGHQFEYLMPSSPKHFKLLLYNPFPLLSSSPKNSILV